ASGTSTSPPARCTTRPRATAERPTRSSSRCPRRPPEDRPMLSFDEEAGLTTSISLTPPIPGLAIQPSTGFVPTSAAQKEELAPAGNAFRRVTVDDKRVINSKADLNQLVPFKYKWAWRSTSPPAPTTGCRRKST